MATEKQELAIISLKLGFTKDYFYVMRKSASEKFTRVCSFDSCFEESVRKYITFVDDLFDWFYEWYYDTDDEDEIFKILKEYGFYRNPSKKCVIDMFSQLIFLRNKSTISFSYTKVKKLESFKKYLENKMKAVIQSKDKPQTGYTVTFEDGRVFECDTIDEAMAIKNNGGLLDE